MKIAIWHNLPSGGGKRALHDHVRGLLSRGHTLESWCPPTADQSYLPLNELITEHVVPLAWPPRPSRHRIVRFARGHWNMVKAVRAMDEHCRRCAGEINQGDFDVLFANSCMFVGSAPIGRYVSIPTVLYLQEPYRRLYEATPRLPWLAVPSPGHLWWMPRYAKTYLRDMMKIRGFRVQAREEVSNAHGFDAILANSLFSRESILRAYGLSAQVCYLGIDTTKFVDRHLTRGNFVVGIGAFTPEKNIRLVIEAVAQVHGPRPAVVWIGNFANPAYVEELLQLASSLSVDFVPKVRIGDDEIVELLNRATMMVYAPRLEPFGLAPLEANACGLPVVAVAEGGVRETVSDGVNGLLVEHGAQALAQAITRLMSDPAYARSLGESGARLVVERWSLEAATDRLERRLTEVLEAGRSSAVSTRI